MKNWRSYDKTLGSMLFEEPRIFKPSLERTDLEVNTILKRSGIKAGKNLRVLDVACGVGRHSFRLAEKGFDVTGLDYSPDYIETASSRVPRRLASRLRFIRGDMKRLRTVFSRDSFDLVVCLWNSWGCFEKRSDDLVAFREMVRVLKPGGKLAMTIFHLPGIQHYMKDVPEEMGKDAEYRWSEYRPGKFFLYRGSFEPKRKQAKMEFFLADFKRSLTPPLKGADARRNCSIPEAR